MTTKDDDNLDRPIWGAAQIGREAGLVTESGDVDIRRAFYLLERGYLPAVKIGKTWTTTRRRLRALFAGEAATQTAPRGDSPQAA